MRTSQTHRGATSAPSKADQKPRAVRAPITTPAAPDLPIGSTSGPAALRYDEWPRSFNLPGIACFHDVTAEDLVHHLCRVLHNLAGDLRGVAFELLDNGRPREAAELAEALAISEEVVATDFDHTPRGGLTPLQTLAAKVRGEVLLGVRKGGTRP